MPGLCSFVIIHGLLDSEFSVAKWSSEALILSQIRKTTSTTAPDPDQVLYLYFVSTAELVKCCFGLRHLFRAVFCYVQASDGNVKRLHEHAVLRFGLVAAACSLIRGRDLYGPAELRHAIGAGVKV